MGKHVMTDKGLPRLTTGKRQLRPVFTHHAELTGFQRAAIGEEPTEKAAHAGQEAAEATTTATTGTTEQTTDAIENLADDSAFAGDTQILEGKLQQLTVQIGQKTFGKIAEAVEATTDAIERIRAVCSD